MGAVGVLVELGLEWAGLAGARFLPAAVDEFLPGCGAVEPLDGVQAPAQVAGDLAQAPPFGAQLADQGVVPPGALSVLPGGARLPGTFRLRQGQTSSWAVGGDAGSARQVRWAAAHFSTALTRFCHRRSLSATWTGLATWTTSIGLVGLESRSTMFPASLAACVPVFMAGPIVIITVWMPISRSCANRSGMPCLTVSLRRMTPRTRRPPATTSEVPPPVSICSTTGARSSGIAPPLAGTRRGRSRRRPCGGCHQQRSRRPRGAVEPDSWSFCEKWLKSLTYTGRILTGIGSSFADMQTAEHSSPRINDLAGAVALVTGATSGIGRATAFALAARGARVLVHGRNPARGDQVVSEIRAKDGDAEVLLSDLVVPADVNSLARRAAELGGGHVDILVNNAGLYPIGGLTAQTTAEDIDLAFAVNVRAPFLLVAELAPAMAARGQGAIVNVLTISAQLGMPGTGLYGASKAALGLLTRAWAAEFGPNGVRVNAVSPGPTLTRESPKVIEFIERLAAQAPAGRVATPDEIASAISYLAGPGASFVQGAVLTVDGGRTAV